MSAERSNLGSASGIDRPSARVWVPAIPLPYYRFSRYKCGCGERFRSEAKYRLHWVRAHAQDAENADGPKMDCEMPLTEALILGYGPLLRQRGAQAAEQPSTATKPESFRGGAR